MLQSYAQWKRKVLCKTKFAHSVSCLQTTGKVNVIVTYERI